jgi:GNS1/SUR4 family
MADSTTISSLPLTTLPSIILTTGPFIFFWSLFRQYIAKRGPLRSFTTITTLNSQFYALYSALLAYLLIQSYVIQYKNAQLPSDPFEDRLPLQSQSPITVPLPFNLSLPFTNKTSLSISELGYIYHLSKLYEYVDVFNLLAQGKIIGPHMAFHHITTPYLTYFRILNTSSDDWRIFALANCVHHTFMYAYFGGIGAWLRRVILVTGGVQLVLGLGVEGWWFWRTGGGKMLDGMEGEEEARNRGIAALLLVRYATLFVEEVKAGRGGVEREEREKMRVKEGGEREEKLKDKKRK